MNARGRLAAGSFLVLTWTMLLTPVRADEPASPRPPDKPLPGTISLLGRECQQRTGTPAERFVEHVRAGRASRPGWKILVEGGSATDRTRVAQGIATRLSIPVQRVSLSSLVSKYIGETEKNLQRVFDAAEHLDVILFFDEADELFGARTETADGAERTSKAALALVVKRLEAYEGVVVLSPARELDAETRARLLSRAHASVRLLAEPVPVPVWNRVCWQPTP